MWIAENLFLSSNSAVVCCPEAEERKKNYLRQNPCHSYAIHFVCKCEQEYTNGWLKKTEQLKLVILGFINIPSLRLTHGNKITNKVANCSFKVKFIQILSHLWFGHVTLWLHKLVSPYHDEVPAPLIAVSFQSGHLSSPQLEPRNRDSWIMQDEHNTVCGELQVTQQVLKYLEQKERLVRINDTISKLC